MTFFLPCVPPKATAQHKGAFSLPGGRVRFFKKAHVSKAEDTLSLLLLQHRPAKPMQGPLEVSIQWIFPYRTSEPKRNRLGLIPCVTRPDLDNLSKIISDVMQKAGFYNDDSQISKLTLSKFWGPTPGIGIRIQPLSDVQQALRDADSVGKESL